MSSQLYIGDIISYRDPLTEDIDLLTPSDIKTIESYSSQKRRDEAFSWRVVLRRSVDSRSDIRYKSVGAPYLDGEKRYIGVSHSSKKVAVVISDRACGVDIESIDRDFGRVASRYVTPAEEMLDSGTTPLLPLLWSAKEGLYKVSGVEGLDFTRDISVTQIDPVECIAYGYISDHDQTIALRYHLCDGYIVVYTD